MPKLADIALKTIDGKTQKVGDYARNAMLVVNVASKCGYTPQYKGLEALYEKYENEGLVILGFPANNFLSQEPGTNEQIADRVDRAPVQPRRPIPAGGDDPAAVGAERRVGHPVLML